MAQIASNALVGMPLVTGPIAIAFEMVEKAAYPVDASAAIAGAEAAGYIGEDGVVETNGRETERIKAWGGDTVRVVQNEHTITYQFTFLESKNATVLKAFYGPDNVTIAGDVITIKKTSQILPHFSLDMRMLDGVTKIRNFVPDAQITETGDVTFVHSDVIRYEVTVEAFADADGVKAIQIMDSTVTP